MSGVVEFNMSDGLPPNVMQKLNTNFQNLIGVDNGTVGKVITGTVLPETATDGAIFYNTETGDISVWRNLGEAWAWSSATSADIAHIEETVQEAVAIAEATSQHFWKDTQGAHVTDVTNDEWDEAALDGFSDYDSDSKPYHNMLLNSLGILLRTALNNLVSITRSAIAFYDGLGNSASNVVASFGSHGADIGKQGNMRIVLSPGIMSLLSDTSETLYSVTENSSMVAERSAILVAYEDHTEVDATTHVVNDSLTTGDSATVFLVIGDNEYPLDSTQVTTVVTPGVGISATLTADGIDYVETILETRETGGMLSVDYHVTHYDNAKLWMDGAAKIIGGNNIMTVQNDDWDSADNKTNTFFAADNAVTGNGIRFGVGSGGHNRGVYDPNTNRWLLFANQAGKSQANTDIIYMYGDRSTRINAAAPSSNVYFDAIEGYDSKNDRVFYSHTAYTTDKRMYRSFVAQRMSANGRTSYVNGFYLIIDNSGNPKVSFTSGAAAAWRDGLGLGNLATEDNVSVAVTTVSGSARNTSAISGNSNYAFTIPISVPSGYTPIGIRSTAFGGTGNAYLANRRHDIVSSSSVTVAVRNVSSTSVAANAVTCTVEVYCVKTSAS